MKITEETEVKYTNENELSYQDTGDDDVSLYINNVYEGEVEVWTDRENDDREYIILNYEMVYLDTITKK